MTVVDAEAVAQRWINSRRGSLVGPGAPLAKGAVLNRLEAPTVCYCLVSSPVPGRTAFGAESPDMVAPLSLQVYGPTKGSAALGAVALVNEMLLELHGGPVPVLVELDGAARVRIVCADNVEGPAWQPDFGDVARYVVTADWYLAAL